MTAPASYDRVLALLNRLSPGWPSTDPDTRAGKELGAIATAMGVATDELDAVFPELFPDTAELLIERWEDIFNVPSAPGDDIDTRRNRILSVMQRSGGYTLEKIAIALSGPLDMAPEDIDIYEVFRAMIDESLIYESGTINAATPASVTMDPMYPGEIDDTGVRVYIELSGITDATAELTSPDDTTWEIPIDAATGWYETRTDFLGENPAGIWRLDVQDSANPTLISWKLYVSNDIDAQQIYQLHVLRDPLISGTPDIAEAQRLIRRMAVGHIRSRIIQSIPAICDDPYSVCSRDLVGV